MKIAVREAMVPGATLEDKLTLLDELGYDGIELHRAESLDRGADELRRVFEGHRVRPTTIDGARKLLDPDPLERQAAMAQLRRRLELCARLDATAVLVVPIFGKPLVPDLSPWRTAVDLERALLLGELSELVADTERTGATIMLEPLNRYETHLVNTLDQGAEFCRRVNRPGIRIMADFFHMSIEEADLAESIRRSASFIRYVHVADSNRQQPGRGHLDFRSGFHALKHAGYDGYLGVECRLVGPPVDALKESAVYLRKLWAEA
ncbi:MAG: sugar phosphate isomerase/epimerase family protein [Chloroflexota bacterium]